jgi:hypothetical protein
MSLQIGARTRRTTTYYTLEESSPESLSAPSSGACPTPCTHTLFTRRAPGEDCRSNEESAGPVILSDWWIGYHRRYFISIGSSFCNFTSGRDFTRVSAGAHSFPGDMEPDGSRAMVRLGYPKGLSYFKFPSPLIDCTFKLGI